jgi:endonuclease V-like protein UPF0215 family|tara:strand:- start:2383 stop:2958 length:576 start_codon:yes stop_codon:yes gene_type:complete
VGNLLNLEKKGIRVLGIAESFRKETTKSILAGVVMRADLQIDGFGITRITVGGTDATEGIIKIIRSMNRKDINAIFLNGCIISWFNIVNLNLIHETFQLPIICITYEESEGLEKYIREYFEDWKMRLASYILLGKRKKIKLNNGHELLIRWVGIEKEKDVKNLLDKFTIQGAVPEPLKVSRLLARALLEEK